MRSFNPDSISRCPHFIVRKYEKPESVGSIVLNPAWRTDNSRSLWEVIAVPDEASEVLGLDVEPDDILITAPNRGVYVGDLEGEVGVEVYMLSVHEIARVVPWTRDGEMRLSKGKLLVRPIENAEQASTSILLPDAGRDDVGIVVRVGSGVDIGFVGKKILFTEHAGIETEEEGEKMMIMDEDEVMAILGEGVLT